MASATKRVNTQQQNRAPAPIIPSFGYDYSVHAKIRRNSDHSIPPRTPADSSKVVSQATSHTDLGASISTATSRSFPTGQISSFAIRRKEFTAAQSLADNRPKSSASGTDQLTRPESMYFPYTSATACKPESFSPIVVPPESGQSKVENLLASLTITDEKFDQRLPTFATPSVRGKEPDSKTAQPVLQQPSFGQQPFQQQFQQLPSTIFPILVPAPNMQHVQAPYVLLAQHNQVPETLQGRLTGPPHPEGYASSPYPQQESVLGIFANQSASINPAHFLNQPQNTQRPANLETSQSLAPSPAIIQPQIAIVATDPAALSALLSGGLFAQSFLQPVVWASQQPFGIPDYQVSDTSTAVNSSTNSLPRGQIGWASTPIAPYDKPMLARQSHTPVVPSAMENRPHSDESTTRHSPPIFSPITTNRPSSYSKPLTDFTPSGLEGTQVRENQLKPDVIIQAKHSTTRQKGTVMKSLTDNDNNRESKAMVTPPEGFMSTTRPDLLKGSVFAAEAKHVALPTVPTYREPKKLNPRELFGQLLKSSESGTGKTGREQKDVPTAAGSDRHPRCRDPNSISAYYERMKLRIAGKSIAEKEHHTAAKSATARPFPSGPRPIASGTPRADPNYTSACSKDLNNNLMVASRDQLRSSVHLLDDTTSQGNVTKDPSVMTVAERARRWIEKREKDISGSKRYSTCGFIDQDLIDCGELVPVEDRVRMFDSCNATGGESEEMLDDKPHRSPKVCERVASVVSSTVCGARKTAAVQRASGYFGAPLPYRPATTANKTSMDWPCTRALTSESNSSKVNYASGLTSDTLGGSTHSRQSEGDELTREKRRLFSNAQASNRNHTIRPAHRRTTQPVTLDDLAKANQIILSRLEGYIPESPSSLSRYDDNESLGFQERVSEISTPEASILGK
ncbi:unnamed protein product [Dicrocoelium dendriticum]|nr:unnamed protein product [Dicrocoelium dendriticum]